ncbi:MAG TPA: T9SS type A sorting domain-containing protein, partial [Bacteroidia bacterium]|nr:T9SS type A sorting domain-containing protein [Bacteroidia bacterium]
PSTQTGGCDTVLNTLSNDTAVLYGVNGGWGFTSGSNNYGDLGKAEKFLATNYTAGYQLTAAAFFYGIAVDGITPTTMNVKVWDNTGSGGLPGAQVGASVNQPVATMMTGGNPTLVTFPVPIPVTGDFYLGIDGFAYAATQDDTVALYCNTNLPTHQGGAYDLYSDNTTWIAENDPADWSINVDYYIVAILCSPTLGQVQIVNPTTEVIVYPNPSTGNVYVSTGTTKANEVSSIKVVDALGKTISAANLNTENAGTYKIDMAGVAPGVYFVNVTTTDKTVTRKLVIQ